MDKDFADLPDSEKFTHVDNLVRELLTLLQGEYIPVVAAALGAVIGTIVDDEDSEVFTRTMSLNAALVVRQRCGCEECMREIETLHQQQACEFVAPPTTH